MLRPGVNGRGQDTVGFPLTGQPPVLLYPIPEFGPEESGPLAAESKRRCDRLRPDDEQVSGTCLCATAAAVTSIYLGSAVHRITPCARQRLPDCHALRR